MLANPLVRSGVVTLVVFLFVSAGDLMLGREGISRLDLMMSGDALAALALGAVYLLFALRAEDKKRELERQLCVISEMNHHIRNALQAIVYAQSLDGDHSIVMHEAVGRIEWALDEILPLRLGAEQEPGNSESDKINKIHATE